MKNIKFFNKINIDRKIEENRQHFKEDVNLLTQLVKQDRYSKDLIRKTVENDLFNKEIIDKRVLTKKLTDQINKVKP